MDILVAGTVVRKNYLYKIVAYCIKIAAYCFKVTVFQMEPFIELHSTQYVRMNIETEA
jgi:hypothetical protein